MFIVVVGTTFQKCGLTARQQLSGLRVVSGVVSGYQAISCPFQCVVRSVLWCLVLPVFFWQMLSLCSKHAVTMTGQKSNMH